MVGIYLMMYDLRTLEIEVVSINSQSGVYKNYSRQLHRFLMPEIILCNKNYRKSGDKAA